MKKLVVCLLAISAFVSVAAFAQDTMSHDKDMKSDKAPAAPLKNITGTVKAGGDKVPFVADEDQKSWDVMNPEMLNGHEGHHAKVSAHVDADKNAIHIMSVKMLKN